MNVKNEDSISGLDSSSKEDLNRNKNPDNIPFFNRPSQQSEQYAAQHNKKTEIPRTDCVIWQPWKLNTSYNTTIDNTAIVMEISFECLEATNDFGFKISTTGGHI